MRDGNHYINAVRIAKGLKSFNAVGRLFGITSTAVSLIRNGGGISEDTANKIGHALQIDPGIIYADINAARAKDNVTKKFWIDVSKHLGTAANFLIVACPALLYAQQYILCKITESTNNPTYS